MRRAWPLVQRLIVVDVGILCLLCNCSAVGVTIGQVLELSIEHVPDCGADVGVIDFAGYGVHIRVIVEVLCELVELAEVDSGDLGQTAKCIVLCHVGSEFRTGYFISEVNRCGEFLSITSQFGVNCYCIAETDILGILRTGGAFRLRQHGEAGVRVEFFIFSKSFSFTSLQWTALKRTSAASPRDLP